MTPFDATSSVPDKTAGTQASRGRGVSKRTQWLLAVLAATSIGVGMDYLATGTVQAKAAEQQALAMRAAEASPDAKLASSANCSEVTTKETRGADGSVTRVETKKAGPCPTESAGPGPGTRALFHLAKAALFAL